MNKKLVSIVFLVFAAFNTLLAQSKKGDFYELRVYHYDSKEQERVIDEYLKSAYLPGLHERGIKNVGVFKPISNDTARNKRIFMLIPFKSAAKFAEVLEGIDNTLAPKTQGLEYWNAAHNAAPFKRFESILIKAFKEMPRLEVPKYLNERSKRVYELRSYEGATELLYTKKVHMFNEGGEVNLFKKLGFNAVFYGNVLAGSRKPNLMYMTTFEDMKSRDEHWKAFGSHPEWKTMSGNQYYKNTVSHADIYLLYPTEYSDF